MEIFSNDSALIWLLVGAFLIILEAATSPGLGLFLAGLGALCAGILVKSHVVPASAGAAQIAWFFGFTTLWTIVLWKPLRHFQARQGRGSGGENFRDMIGETAIVGKGGLKPQELGQVIWSGTIMNAQLEGTEALPEGAYVVIKSVSGTTFKVIPK